MAEVAGQRALALAAAVHAHPRRHALGTRVQQAGDVGRVGERARLLVTLLRLVRGRVPWKAAGEREERGTGEGREQGEIETVS